MIVSPWLHKRVIVGFSDYWWEANHAALTGLCLCNARLRELYTFSRKASKVRFRVRTHPTPDSVRCDVRLIECCADTVNGACRVTVSKPPISRRDRINGLDRPTCYFYSRLMRGSASKRLRILLSGSSQGALLSTNVHVELEYVTEEE